MELARVCAGYTPGQSDRLRQAMTHKRSDEEMAKLRAETYAGMASRGITGKAADEIWEKLQGFASFGFPRATRCPSPTSSTCRPGSGPTGPPSTWRACSTPSPWASTPRTRWWPTPGGTGWWCCPPT